MNRLPSTGAAAGGNASGTGTAAPGEQGDVAGAWPVVDQVRYPGGGFAALRTDKVRTPDGEIVRRDVLEHPGAVAVVALDEAERVLLIRQYRHPAGMRLWEIPAGLRDVAGEPPLDTARRELEEETGYRAAWWRLLADVYTSPGISSERIRIFLARELTEIPVSERTFQATHEEAHLIPAWLPLPEAVRLFLTAGLHNGIAATGVLAAHAARTDGFASLLDPGAAGG